MIGLLLAASLYGDPQLLGRLPLPEVSGLAVGVRGLYAHEDSGAGARVVRLDRSGTVLQRYDVDADAVDWEDMAAAPDAEGTPSLWFADVGDNRAARPEVQVHRVAESDPEGPATTYRFRYEDGPRDAETLLVLPGGRRLVVVTKAGAAYASGLDEGVLRRVADLPLRSTGTAGGPLGALGQVLATGGSVSSDGTRVAVRTYTDLYEWRLLPDLVATFAQEPAVSPLPATPQGEAVAHERDGLGVLVASEGDPAPLHRLAGRPAPPPAAPAPAVTAPQAREEGSRSRRSSWRSSWPAWAGAGAVALVVLAAAAALSRRRRREG